MPRLHRALASTAFALAVTVPALMPFAATTVAADAGYASKCSVNLRTGTTISSAIKKVIASGTTVTASATVTGGSWSASCPTAVSGSSWLKIVAVSGKSTSSLYGVSAVYAAKGLFKAVTTTTPPPPSTTGIPAMPAGNLLRKSFSDGALAPFRAVTYPNDHPGDAMSYACNYATDSSVISVHNGYLDLRANRRSDGRYNCAFLSTGMDGRGGGATFSVKTGYVQFAARMNVGYATWQAPIWLLNTVTGWHSAEIDVAEVIDGKLTYNLHGTVNRQVASTAPPADLASNWHIFGVAKAADHITFTMDGKVIGRWNGSMPDPMALLADSKVGFQWEGVKPNGSTPSPSWVNLAWVTVSSTIPAGL